MAIRRWRLSTLSACAAITGIALVLLTAPLRAHRSGPTDIESFAGGQILTLHGVITDAPDRRELSTRYTVSVDSMIFGSQSVPAYGKILAVDRAQWPEHHYGDEVVVRGRLERPGIIDGFAYDKYLSLKNIHSVVNNAHIATLNAIGQYPQQDIRTYRLLSVLYGLRQRFERQITLVFPEPHASLLTGLLTGSRGGLSEKLLTAFRTSGLSHIIAISGYNITIVIVLIDGLLFWIARRWRLWPAIAAISFFTLFVGASASVVRAAIMGILGLVALHAGRSTTARLSILWTALVMLLWNPDSLWYDTGFQLSFLAVIGLSEFGPLLARAFRWAPKNFGIRESLIATFSAQIATLPVTVFTFGQLSLIAPVANLLVAPLIPLTMLLGAAAVIVSFALMFPGLLIGYAAWGLLELIILIARACAAVPFAALTF